MAERKQRKMVALKVMETSGVDHPAHLQEGWIVLKNAEEDSVSEEFQSIEADLDAIDEVEVDDSLVERVVELEAALSKAREQIASLEAEKATDGGGDDDMMKSVPEAVREMLNKAQSEADSAREELRKEREAQRDREFVAKAAGWNLLPIEADSFGPALRQVADIAPALADAITKALDSANAQQEAAAIFAEIGASGRPTSGSAYGQVEALAKSAVDKGEYKTIEQAISGLIATNPELYEQYRNEQR